VGRLRDVARGVRAGLSVVFAVLRLRRFDRGPLELVAHRLVRPARATGAVSGSRG